jgi:hypothetical protein
MTYEMNLDMFTNAMAMFFSRITFRTNTSRLNFGSLDMYFSSGGSNVRIAALTCGSVQVRQSLV